ncbi:MAG: hypothetical protein H0U27_00745 [Nitrosopumilus sp.]|nr:hypothetical protein [Nitrosopumilus sp.]
MNIVVNSVNVFDPYKMDALFLPGLTFNDVKQNITKKADIAYYQNLDIAEGASACVGIAIGIIALVSSVFLALKNPEHTIFIVFSGQFLFFCSWFGVSTFGLMIGSKISDWIRSSEKAHLQFFKQFEGTATIEINDLKYQPSQVLQKEMIAKMNFDQLSFARHSLGDKKFRELIWDINKHQHNSWKTILNFSSYSKDMILKHLNTSGIKFMIKNSPLFARELRKQLKGVHDQEILRLLHPFPLFAYSDDVQKDNNFTFTFANGNTIQTNKGLLIARSNYFKNSELKNFDEKEVFARSYDDLSILIKALTSDILFLDKEQVLNLIRIADECDEDILLKYIEY